MKAGIPSGLVYAVLLTVGSFAVVIVRAFSPGGGGWEDILKLLPVLGGAVVLSVAMVGGVSGFAKARLRRLEREFPDAVVFTAEMTPALKQLVKSQLAERTQVEPAPGVPHFFTAVASDEGLSFWSGGATRPVRFWEIDWSSVLELRPEEFQLQNKSVRGIRAYTGDSTGALEIAPYPHGFFSVSWDKPSVDALAVTLREKSSKL